MTITAAIVLGFVQGFTEFLPISSSGHLVLVGSLFDIDMQSNLALYAVLHLATLLSVVIYFFGDIAQLIQTALRKLGRLPVNRKDELLLYTLIAGTVPAVLIGFTAESLIEESFNHPIVVAIFLFIASLFFIFAEWRYSSSKQYGEMTIVTGFKIGLFQAMALLPGFSRSGSTIAGGMLLGLTRLEATRFSFLLSIPVIAGVGAKKFLDLIVAKESVEWVPIFISAATASIVAFITIHYFLAFVRRYTLWPFVWYTMILAFFIAFVFFFG